MSETSITNIKPMLLSETASVLDAIGTIDAGKFGIALVVDHDRCLIGVLTDRDTRQAMLEGAKGEDPIGPYIISNPVTASSDMDDDSIFAIMQTSGKHQIPILDEDGRVLALRSIGEFVGTIPLAVPNLGGNEWKYVKHCLDTNFVSSVGSYVTKFEDNIAEFIGVKRAVACISGTAALHIACIVNGVERGDEVIMPALTFIASANAISQCGAKPIFIDSAKGTIGLDPQALKIFLAENIIIEDDGKLRNKITKARVSALVVVHIFGHPVDMNPLKEICQTYNLPIIEDAAESLGSTYHEQQTGGLGSMGILSFNGNKIITSGGGGMIVTDDEKMADRALHLTTQAKTDPFRYQHDEIGYNYRPSNVLAAIGLAQMEKISEHVENKRRVAKKYSDLLSGLPGCNFFEEQSWAQSNYWLNFLMVPEAIKEGLLAHLNNKNIMARPVWNLMNEQPMYANCQTDELANAKKFHATGVCLPSSVNITEAEVEHICSEIRSWVRNTKKEIVG